MYFVSLQGHRTSCWPGSSGAPTECRHLTKSASAASSAASATSPARVLIRIDRATYAEWVISTPNIGVLALTGPMQKGTTYIVRPRIEPRYSSVIVCFISAGATQLLVGPASSADSEQMKVRSSTRATSADRKST